MTDRSVPFDRQKAPVRPDFDLIEDHGTPAPSDGEVFNRALSALLAGEGRDPAEDSAGVDIDLDDFEAFNRELDARLAEARLYPVEDEPTEDLGSEVIPAIAPVPAPAAASPTGPIEVADDVVTLGTAPATRAGTRATAAATPLAPAQTPTAASAAPTAPAPAPIAARSGSGLALAIGLIGLLAGAAGLWINQSHQAYLARLESVVAKATSTPAQPVTPALSPELVALDTRIREIAERLEALDAAGGDTGESSIHSAQGLEERLARAEAQLAAAKAADRAAPTVTEQPKPSPDATPSPQTKPAASEPARTSEAPAPATPAAVSRPLATATGGSTEAPVPATPAAVTRPLAAATGGSSEAPAPATPVTVTKPSATETGSSTASPVGAAGEPPAKAAKATTDSVPLRTAEPTVAAPAPARPAPIAEATAAPAATPTAPVKAKKPAPKPAGGAWTVVVESFPTEAAAYKRLNKIESSGLIADVLPVQINGETWHRVVVPGYGSQDDAKAAAADMRGRSLGQQPWVFQRKSD